MCHSVVGLLALVLLGLLSLSTVISSAAVDDTYASFSRRVIKRTAYGVIFRYQSQLKTHSDVYLHHLLFPLPTGPLDTQIYNLSG